MRTLPLLMPEFLTALFGAVQEQMPAGVAVIEGPKTKPHVEDRVKALKRMILRELQKKQKRKKKSSGIPLTPADGGTILGRSVLTSQGFRMVDSQGRVLPFEAPRWPS